MKIGISIVDIPLVIEILFFLIVSPLLEVEHYPCIRLEFFF